MRITQITAGEIDLTKEHFALDHDAAPRRGIDDGIIALVGPSQDGVLLVEYLVGTNHPINSFLIEDVNREIKFYFVDLNEPNP